MRDLRAFAFGVLAIGVLAYAAAGAFAVAAQAAGRSVAVGLGPVAVFAVEQQATTASMTFGPGLLLIAVLGGFVNAGGARLIQWRAGRRPNRVE